jgi:TrpR family trp operon transcriptional repressor
MEVLARIMSHLEPDEIEIFLGQILTKAEMKKVQSRWEIIRLLYEGVSQRTIASRLSLSLCNVTRGSRELKRADSVLAKILDNGYHLPPQGGAGKNPSIKKAAAKANAKGK